MAWTVDLHGRAVHARNIEIIDIVENPSREKYGWYVRAVTSGGQECILASRDDREEASREAEKIASMLLGKRVSLQPRKFEILDAKGRPKRNADTCYKEPAKFRPSPE